MMSLDSVCARCGEPFQAASTEATFCNDCVRDGVRLLHQELRRRRHPKLVFFGNLSAVVVLVLGCMAMLLIIIGWIWTGLEVVRRILGS
jgi:hypothetical protein